MLDYKVAARRIDTHGSTATAKEAHLVVDTDLAGRVDAFNPVELLLAALAACILKGAARVAPMIGFAFDGIEVALSAIRQDAPPRLTRIDYVVTVDTGETDARLDLLLRNLQKYGTIHNTLAPSVEIAGSIRRKG